MGALVGLVFPGLTVVTEEGKRPGHAIKVYRRIVALVKKHFVYRLEVLTNAVCSEVNFCDVVAGDDVDGKKAGKFLPVFDVPQPLVWLNMALIANF